MNVVLSPGALVGWHDQGPLGRGSRHCFVADAPPKLESRILDWRNNSDTLTMHSDGVLSGVEKRRSEFSLPVAIGQVFTCPPQSGLTWFCFLFPLIELDRRVSRIQLSE